MISLKFVSGFGKHAYYKSTHRLISKTTWPQVANIVIIYSQVANTNKRC